jgi:glycine cleavage system H protein
MTDDDLLDKLPADRLYAPEMDMWVRLEEDGMARLGATHLVAAHGQFMYFTPRPVDTVVERDRSLGVMETAKTAVAIHSPISGRVVEVNEAVAGDVAPVEQDPYGEGWMFRMEPSNLEAERELLLDAAAYAQWLEPRRKEKEAEKPIVDEFEEDLSVDPNRGY